MLFISVLYGLIPLLSLFYLSFEPFLLDLNAVYCRLSELFLKFFYIESMSLFIEIVVYFSTLPSFIFRMREVDLLLTKLAIGLPSGF